MTVPREFLRQLIHQFAQGIGVQPQGKLEEPGFLNREQETSHLVIDLRKNP
jgi:hypothetical protein